MTSTIQNGEGERLEILAMKCLADHEREAYANPNVIRAMLDFASLAREPATADVGREAKALVFQLRAVIHRLNGQAYSSTLSQLNALDAALSRAAPSSDSTMRHLRDALDDSEELMNGSVVITPEHAKQLNADVDAWEASGDVLTGEQAWDELVNVDDRTSPEEYPDMCLITRDELIDFMDRAAPSSEPAIAEGERYLSDRFKWAAPGDQQEDVWLVRFCDNDVRDAIYTGPDAESEAWAAWNRHAPGYNMFVFRLAALAQSSTPPASKGVEVPAGWKLVPVEPTEAMSKVGSDAAFQTDSHGDHWIARASAAWTAMLATAPTPSNDTLWGRGEVERLRQVLADATPVPWRMEHGAISAHIHQVDGLHWLANCVIGQDSWHSPAQSRGVKDATLIVEAVNALPHLLDLLAPTGAIDGGGEVAVALLKAAGITEPVRVVNREKRDNGTEQWSEVIRSDRTPNNQVAHCADQEDADAIAYLINAALQKDTRHDG